MTESVVSNAFIHSAACVVECTSQTRFSAAVPPLAWWLLELNAYQGGAYKNAWKVLTNASSASSRTPCRSAVNMGTDRMGRTPLLVKRLVLQFVLRCRTAPKPTKPNGSMCACNVSWGIRWSKTIAVPMPAAKPPHWKAWLLVHYILLWHVLH